MFFFFFTSMCQINLQHGKRHLFSFIYWNSRINHCSLEDRSKERGGMLMPLSALCFSVSRSNNIMQKKYLYFLKYAVILVVIQTPKQRLVGWKICTNDFGDNFHFSHLQRHNEDKEEASSGLWGNNCWIPEKGVLHKNDSLNLQGSLRFWLDIYQARTLNFFEM